MAASLSLSAGPTVLCLLNCASSSAQTVRRQASQDFRCFIEAYHHRLVVILTRPRLLNVFFIISIIRMYMRLVVCSSQRNSMKNRVPRFAAHTVHFPPQSIRCHIWQLIISHPCCIRHTTLALSSSLYIMMQHGRSCCKEYLKIYHSLLS